LLTSTVTRKAGHLLDQLRMRVSNALVYRTKTIRAENQDVGPDASNCILPKEVPLLQVYRRDHACMRAP
jgi:hypothetical protein